MYDFKDDIYYEVYEQQLYPTTEKYELILECELFSQAYDHIMGLQKDIILAAEDSDIEKTNYWTYRRLYDKEGHLVGTITAEIGDALVDTGKIAIFVLDKINDTLVAYTVKEIKNG